MAIDLDAKRAARREAQGVGPEVIFGGVTYELPAELPFGVLEAFRAFAKEETAPSALADVAQALLGEHYEAFKASKPSVADLNELIGGVMQEYGVADPLDSSAS